MKLFTEHPATVGETYLQHFRKAMGFASALTVNGLACFIHAFFPFLFKTNASDCVISLHDELKERRERSTKNS